MARLFAAVLTACVTTLMTLGACLAEKTPVYVAGFFPYSKRQPEGALGRGVVPAVELALLHINRNDKLLGDYKLQIYWNNTKCNAAYGLKAFFDMMSKEPKKVMLFGAACPHVTDPIAKTSKYWHLTQLSYADTHPMFSSNQYPNLFRVVPSEIEFNSPRVALLKAFNWTSVGILYQNKPRYALAHNSLLNDLDAANITVAEDQSFTDDLVAKLTKLKEKDVRIILGNFDEDKARQIFCEAFKQEMYGRKYQWLIVSMYTERWWEIQVQRAVDGNGNSTSFDEYQQVDCTQEELLEALEGHIGADLLPLRTNNDVTLSGLTAAEYNRQYDQVRSEDYSRFHGYAYDGMWTIALAIEAVARNLSMPLSIQDFQYREPFWGQLFLKALNDTSFEGVTGPVRFVNNSRLGFILLKQFQEGKEEGIGEYDGSLRKLDLTKGKNIKWRGSAPPRDRTLLVIESTRISIPIYAVLAAIACLGILVACSFLVINIKFRNQRYIKMSSPYLNNLIIIGCILTYMSVILLGLDSELTSQTSLPHICAVRAWVLMAGFTLAFGSMFSKTWRVHTIFTNIKLNKKVIKDYQLFMVVGVLLVIDLGIMTTWQIIDPFYRETKRLQSQVHPHNEDVLIIPEMEYCKSNKMTAFLGAIYAYKGLLMVFGCFLTWETRHVSIPALNDSKYIGMSVYNAVIMCVMGAAISFILSDQQNAAFVIISTFIIFCSTTTLCLVFVPKLVELKRNPTGSDKRVRATFKPSTRRNFDSDESDIQERIRLLQEENQKYRKALREKDVELQALLRQLGEQAQDIFGREMRERIRSRRAEISRREDDDEVDSVASLNSSTNDAEDKILKKKSERGALQPFGLALLGSFLGPDVAAAAAAGRNQSPRPLQQDSDDNTKSLWCVEEEFTTQGDTEVYILEADEEEEEQDVHVEKEVTDLVLDEDLDLAGLCADNLSYSTTASTNSLSDSNADSDSESESAALSCSVFSVDAAHTASVLQLQRAFSWGRQGYRPITDRSKKKNEYEAAMAAGSWPSILPRKTKSKDTEMREQLSPKKLVHGCGLVKRTRTPLQSSHSSSCHYKKCKEVLRPPLETPSTSNIKCDVVEYL